MRTKSFTIGDTVTLRHGKWNAMQARVGGLSEAGDVLRLNIAEPPVWFRRLLQARGIFIGAHANWLLFLFRDHQGQWTDQQSLEHFTVE